MNSSDYDALREVQRASETIFDGVILHVMRDEVQLPNGNSSGRELIRHVGAVAVVPLLDDGRVIVERQFRYPIDRVITEIPAGKLDSKQEDRLEAAKRELREETGYTAENWLNIGDFHPAAAYSDEKITLYLATGLKKGEQQLDDDEFLFIDAVPLRDLVADIISGRITDGKTQAGILKAAIIKGIAL